MISRLSIFTILSVGLFAGCTGGSPDDGTAQALAAVACTTSADCAAGFECEAQPQGRFCKQHEPEASGTPCTTDAECAAGQECELEHGAGTCKAHGGDDHHADGGADRGDRGGEGGAGNDDHGQGGGAGEANDDHGQGGEAGEPGEHRDAGAEHHGGDDGNRDGGHRGSGK